MEISHNVAQEDQESDDLHRKKPFVKKHLTLSVVLTVFIAGLAVSVVLLQRNSDIRKSAAGNASQDSKFSSILPADPSPLPPSTKNCTPILTSPENNIASNTKTMLKWYSCNEAVSYNIKFKGPGVLRGSMANTPNPTMLLSPVLSSLFQNGENYTWSVQACLDAECTSQSPWSALNTINWQGAG